MWGNLTPHTRSLTRKWIPGLHRHGEGEQSLRSLRMAGESGALPHVCSPRYADREG